MDRALSRIMASIALVFICSCATEKTHIRMDRSYCTDINSDEGVVIVLNTFLRENPLSRKEKRNLLRIAWETG